MRRVKMIPLIKHIKKSKHAKRSKSNEANTPSAPPYFPKQETTNKPTTVKSKTMESHKVNPGISGDFIIETVKKVNWSVNVTLSIKTKKPISTNEELMDIIGVWTDKYSSPIRTRSLFTGMYIMSICGLKPVEESIYDENHIFFNIKKRISFNTLGDMPVGNPIGLNWSYKTGVSTGWHLIKFIVEVENTNRPCIPFESLIKNPSETFLNIKPSDILAELSSPSISIKDGSFIFTILPPL